MEISLGLSGASGLFAYDPLLSLAAATTRGDTTIRAEAGFSWHLNFRLFQQYPSTPAVSFAQIAVIAHGRAELVKPCCALGSAQGIGGRRK
jgi:hypothetical protein